VRRFKTPKEFEQVGGPILQHLELAAALLPVHELEGLERDPIAQQARPEVEPVAGAGGVVHLDGLERYVLVFETHSARHFRVIAAHAEVAITRLDVAVVDRVVAGAPAYGSSGI
jgi:hypothetical protein